MRVYKIVESAKMEGVLSITNFDLFPLIFALDW